MQHRISLTRYQRVDVFSGTFCNFVKGNIIQFVPDEYLPLQLGQFIKR